MAGTDNELIRGIYDLTNVQDRLRTYAQTKEYFQFWALRQVNTISLLKIISEKFGTVPADQVSDWEMRYPEFDEIPYQFKIAETTSTTDSSRTKLKISNMYQPILNNATRLFVEGIYVSKGITAASEWGTTRDLSRGRVLPEIMRIVSVGDEDSGGAGYFLCTVRRGHPVDHGLTAGDIPDITTSMQITVSNLVSRANDYPKPPFSKNSDYLSNYIQITRMSYGLGEHMVQGGGIETYLAEGGSEYLNIQYQLAETYMMKAIERGILTGRKAKNTVQGNLEFESGGIFEFLQADSDHYLSANQLAPSVKRINNLVRRMADTSGVKELWWFTGTHLSEGIANAYEDKSIYYTNGELSMKYRMKIKTLESVGRDLIIHHVTAPILNELGMANSGVVLNLTEYNYNQKSKFGSFQIAHKVKFTDAPENDPSYKSNEGFKGKWRELYGAWGLVRRLSDTHFFTYDFAEPSS